MEKRERKSADFGESVGKSSPVEEPPTRPSTGLKQENPPFRLDT